MRHEPAIRRLQEIGQRQGHLTLEQVKSHLPVDEMTPDEIGGALLRLEEAGVEVELDEELLRPRPDAGNGPDVPADSLKLDAEPEPRPPQPVIGRPAAPPLAAGTSAGSPAPADAQPLRFRLPWPLAAILALVVIAVILLVVLLS
jgi:hypothetical protein